VFKDEQVRKAIAHATNLDQMKQVIYGGVGNKIADPIKYPEFWNKETNLYEFNVDQARQMLEDAGYTWGDNGRLHYPDG
jgi:peptide/nickel transport system substrate-binding protein